MWDPFKGFESAVLSNGLTVYAAHWPDRPWQRMNFLIHSGAEQDELGTEGTAHFVEHLVSENGSVPQQEMEGFIRQHGGGYNFGSTGFVDTNYGFVLPAQDAVLREGLAMFGSALLSARIRHHVERERQVILGEFRQYYPNDYEHELELRKNLALFEGHALERMALPLGTLDSIARITQADLQAYYDAYYTPANMTIVAVGNKTLGELITLLEQSPFAVAKPGVRTPMPKPVGTLSAPGETRYVYRQSDYISTPVEVGEYRSWAKIPGAMSRYAEMIFDRALSQRLFEEVRLKRAWSYDIHTHIHPLIAFREFKITSAGVMLEAMGSIESVVGACVESVGSDMKLFKKIKHESLASAEMQDLNSVNVCDVAMMSLAQFGRISSVEHDMQGLEEVQLSDMEALAQCLQPDMCHTQLAVA